MVTTHEEMGAVIHRGGEMIGGGSGINPASQGAAGLQKFHPVALPGQGGRRGNPRESPAHDDDFSHQPPIPFPIQHRPTAPSTEKALSHLERRVRPFKIW